MADIKKQLGQRIKYFRKLRGFSQEELAEKIGMSTRGLGNVETGRYFMSMIYIEKLIEVLNLEPYDLFVFDKNSSTNIVFEDVVKKLENFKNNNKKLYAISSFLDCL